MTQFVDLKNALCVAAILLLTGCAATIPKSVETIRTNTQLLSTAEFPLSNKVRYYFPAELYQERYHLFDAYAGNLYVYPGPAMKQAIEFVLPSYFVEPAMLDENAEYSEIFVFSAETSARAVNVSRFDYAAKIGLRVVDTEGKERFSSSSETTVKSGAAGDQQALQNAYSAGIKDNLIKYFNTLGNVNQAYESKSHTIVAKTQNLKAALALEKPFTSGTGFIVNQSGEVLTSAHILRECLHVEISDQQGLLQVSEKHKSVLLDLAVLSGRGDATSYANFNSSNALSLGESVFTIGYPLSDILAGSPNLTKGDISSTTGLKGAKNFFQFTAPIQPGNSGGPLLRDNGEVLGIVTSTLLFNSGAGRPQNVNFAISSDLIKRYFENNQVAFQSADSTSSLENAIAASKEYVVKVACYR